MQKLRSYFPAWGKYFYHLLITLAHALLGNPYCTSIVDFDSLLSAYRLIQTAALLGEAGFFVPDYQCNSPVTPSDFNRLISEYRLTQTAYPGRLIGEPALYLYRRFDRLISGYRFIQTTLLGEATLFFPGYERNSPVAPSDFDRLYQDAALPRPPHWGTPTIPLP